MCFHDALEIGYGSSVYSYIPKSHEYFHVSYVMSRKKVAPIKQVTLPAISSCKVA